MKISFISYLHPFFNLLTNSMPINQYNWLLYNQLSTKFLQLYESILKYRIGYSVITPSCY